MNKTTPARDPAGHEPSSQTTDPDAWRNPKVLTSVAAGALLLFGWLLRLAEVPGTTSLVLYLTAIPIGGYYFGREAIEELLIERRVGIELLMSTAAVVAALTGQIAEGAILVFLYSISEAAEEYTEEKTRAAIRALMELAPQQALVRRNGEEIPVSVGELRVGDTFIVKPGQSVPTDGEIKIGASSVDQAPVTGESVPVEKGPGDAVFAGSINGEGALEVRATKSFADNTISRIVRMVEEAQERKGRNQRFIERFGARYSPAVLLVGALVAVVPPLAFSAEWSTWVTRGTVFIVAAAPCALVISIPITLVASLGTAARQGVLIKGGIYLEELAKVSVVAMDKTGTLTRGEPEVTDVVVLLERVQGETLSGQILLGLAAGIERRSNHPLAQAIVRHAEQRSAPQMELSDFHSLTGAGASARLDGRPVYVGSPEMFRRKLGLSFSSAQEKIDQLQKEGKTVVAVGEEEELWGLIALRDRVRPNARQALDDLHAAGIEKVVMLTGDSEPTARAIAAQLGIDNVYSELRPEDKVAKVRQLAERYGQVAMVGDGVNDAPALAEASIGIAMGAAGSDVALETADVALMADELEKLAYAIGLARRNRAVVNQNLVLSSIVILFFVAGAVAGTFSLPITVLGHEVSEFVVIGSGLRMLRA